MAVRTMRDEFAFTQEGKRASLLVLAVSYRLKVQWVHAMANTALMIDHQPVRDWTDPDTI
jgi:hypothetical protein